MEQFVNELIIGLLKSPIFFIMFSIGAIYLIIVIIKRIKSFFNIGEFVNQSNRFKNINSNNKNKYYQINKSTNNFTDDIKKDFAYNLDSNENVCPRCGGGLKIRKGKYGQFFGCSNYPKCRYTKNLK